MLNKTLRFNLLLFFCSLLFSLILAELLLRIFHPAPINWKFPQEYYDYDPEIGQILRPNQYTYTHDKVVSTNSIGIRDSDYSNYPGPSIKRVLAIGDSQTFGNGLELSDTWPKQLESMLNNSGEITRWEILNAGLPASDT